MITVTFFTETTTREAEYSGNAGALIAALDMAEHIKAGGYCMAEYNNRAVLIQSMSQLFPA